MAELVLPAVVALSMVGLVLWTWRTHLRRGGTYLDGWSLTLLAFALTYPVSAAVHFFEPYGQARGFYDLVRSESTPKLTYIYGALALVAVAFGAMCVGYGRPRSSRVATDMTSSRPLAMALGLIFFAAGVWGTYMLVASSGDALSMLTTVDRQRELSTGFARFYFASRWLSWGVVFITYALLTSSTPWRAWIVFCVCVIAVLLVLGNIYWSGGRTEGLLALVPLVVVINRVRPDLRRPLSITLTLVLAVYMTVVTIERTVIYAGTGDENVVLHMLDWHLGRFSMIGLGFDLVREYGFRWGGTLFSGLVDVIDLPLTLFGATPYSARGVTSYVGEYLLGDEGINGIVPGSICELYFNFGVVGVIAGYFALGRLVSWLVRTVAVTSSLGAACTCIYSIVLLCTGFIAGSASTWFYILVTGGLPALLLMALELAARGRYGKPNIRQERFAGGR